MKILKMLLFLLVIVAIGLGVAVKLFQQSIQPKVAVEDTYLFDKLINTKKTY